MSVCIFGKKNITYFGKNNITYYRSDIMSFSVHLLKGFMILTCLVTDDVNLDHLAKVVSPLSSYYSSLCS